VYCSIDRTKELGKEKREELNLLLLRQRYLKIKMKPGEHHHLKELKLVHLLIEKWYTKESEKVQHQSKIKEFQSSERSSIYHHELHKKGIKRTSILKLQTNDGIIEGHYGCASFLEQTVEDLRLHPWSCLGPALSDVMRGVFSGQKLTKSMRTSLMVFGSKPRSLIAFYLVTKEKFPYSIQILKLQQDWKLDCSRILLLILFLLFS
jgi:hypothetical protein